MKRTDKYGGNFVNRVRFLKEIMEEVRKNVGPDFPVTVRFSAIEEAVGGRTMEESRPLAMLLEQWGADALHISASVYGNHINGIISSMYTPRAWLVDYAQEVKQLVKIPVFTVNHIADPFVAESILAAGKADIIGMGRESLAEPEFPNKAKAGMLRISESASDVCRSAMEAFSAAASSAVLSIPRQEENCRSISPRWNIPRK